jgi:hypothetical protein
MTISVSDFQNWKSDPVTQAFMTACEERVEDAKEVLANSAGLDPINDNVYRGFILAYREMQDFRIDGLGEEQ